MRTILHVHLAPIEDELRDGEVLDPATNAVVRGWPLTVDGILRNADATRNRFSRKGTPFIAISADVTVPGWRLDAILASPRLRTRRLYASAPVGLVQSQGYVLLATFLVPHYSVALPSYTEDAARRLLRVLGEPILNPYFIGRSP